MGKSECPLLRVAARPPRWVRRRTATPAGSMAGSERATQDKLRENSRPLSQVATRVTLEMVLEGAAGAMVGARHLGRIGT